MGNKRGKKRNRSVIKQFFFISQTPGEEGRKKKTAYGDIC